MASHDIHVIIDCEPELTHTSDATHPLFLNLVIAGTASKQNANLVASKGLKMEPQPTRLIKSHSVIEPSSLKPA